MERSKSTSLLDCSRIGKHCAPSLSGICDLPDSILSHILSFLPTKNAVATSILSQRWKFLWTMTNNLEFVFYWGSEVDRFVEFVNYVLLLHNPGFLNGFTLSWETGCMLFHVNAWTSIAISKNVRKLNLYVGIYEFPIPFQRSIFSCQLLQSLKLNVRRNVEMFESLIDAYCISQEICFFLPKLESLELQSVIFESEETLCKLLAGCPVLKYLCLRIKMAETRERCHLDDGIAFRCIISSASLRRLVLIAYDEDEEVNYRSICGVQLDAPSLNYIELDQISSICIQQTPIYLAEANIQLAGRDIRKEDRCNSVVEALHAFDSAKKLVFGSEVIQAFKSATIETKAMFNQLTRLEVTKNWINWIDLHHFLLQLGGSLEVFIVHQDDPCVWYDCSHDEEEKSRAAAIPNIVPRCLSNSLRLVVIDGYATLDDEGEDDFRTISYILKRASVLQLMEIRLLEDQCEVIQKISELPRKSQACEVVFLDRDLNQDFHTST